MLTKNVLFPFLLLVLVQAIVASNVHDDRQLVKKTVRGKASSSIATVGRRIHDSTKSLSSSTKSPSHSTKHPKHSTKAPKKSTKAPKKSTKDSKKNTKTKAPTKSNDPKKNEEGAGATPAGINTLAGLNTNGSMSKGLAGGLQGIVVTTLMVWFY